MMGDVIHVAGLEACVVVGSKPGALLVRKKESVRNKNATLIHR